MPVVRANRLPGVELIEACAEVLAAGLPPQPRAAVREPRLLVDVVEGGLEQVWDRHRVSGGCSPSQ
jgi:hypothetical protein